MSIAVLYKWAPNPQDAAVGPDGCVDWSRTKASLSDYDPVAIEVGRKVADSLGENLIGISLGENEVATPLAKKNVLSRGCDQARVVTVEAMHELSVASTARMLADLVEGVDSCSLVVAGDSSVDEGRKFIPSMVAAYLGWPVLSDVVDIVADEAGWRVTQRAGAGERTVCVIGPVVAQIATDAVTARIPGMRDILQAAKKPLEVVKLPVPAECSVITEHHAPEKVERAGKVFSGPDAPAQVVEALRTSGQIA